MTEQEMKEIAEIISRQVGVVREDVQHKFDILVEGPQMLSEKIERVEEKLTLRLDRIETKIEKFDLDLTAHRLDTEAHRGVYQICEPE